MSSVGSVSQWITRLRRGDSIALEMLWERYQAKLVDEAQRRLRKLPKWIADKEDVAESVLISVCRAQKRAGCSICETAMNCGGCCCALPTKRWCESSAVNSPKNEGPAVFFPKRRWFQNNHAIGASAWIS